MRFFNNKNMIVCRSEQVEQEQLVYWIENNYPSIVYTASCGGMRTSMGVAKKMKRAGYKKGCPDIMIFEKRGNYGGLFIELKREDGGTKSTHQKQWNERLNRNGYKAVFCHGAEEAKEVIKIYLDIIQ